MRFFSKPKNQFLLRQSIEYWQGVPYQHMGTTQGGVDCVKLLGLLLIDCGALNDIDRDVYYPRDWHIHSKEEVVLNSIKEHCEKYLNEGLSYSIEEYKNQRILFGQAVTFTMKKGRPSNHIGVFIDHNKFFHAIDGRGCYFSEFNFVWKERATNVFTLLELEA